MTEVKEAINEYAARVGAAVAEKGAHGILDSYCDDCVIVMPGHKEPFFGVEGLYRR